MAEPSSTDAADSGYGIHHDPHHHRRELMRDANTMAVYVAICLIPALMAIPQADLHRFVIVAIWGVTLGLALTHWFAFRLATRLVNQGHVGKADLELGGAQMLGAAATAVIASITAMLTPEQWELRMIAITLGLFIAAIAYLAVRRGGGGRHHALGYALVMLIAAVGVVELKHLLSGK